MCMAESLHCSPEIIATQIKCLKNKTQKFGLSLVCTNKCLMVWKNCGFLFTYFSIGCFVSYIATVNSLLSRWRRGKESACQCRKHGFCPWVRKILWSRKWQPNPVFLPGKFHGQRSMADYSPWGCKESDTTKHATHATHSWQCSV